MEGLGLGLSAISLAIQLFDGVVKGFEIFESAAHADQAYEQCKLFLRIEHERFEQWGIMSGLGADDPSQYAAHVKRNGALTVALLSELFMLFKSLRKQALENEYLEQDKSTAGSHLVGATIKLADISGLRQLDRVANAQQAKRGYDMVMRLPEASQQRKAFRQRWYDRATALAKDTKKVAQQPKRFKWAVRDMPEFDKGLHQVRRLVDSLTELLSNDQMAALVESTNSFKLMLLQLTTDVSEMRSLLLVGQTSDNMSLSGTTLAGSVSTGGIRDAHTKTSFWAVATQFSIDASDMDLSMITPLQPGYVSITGEVSHDALTPAKSPDGCDLWLEWKSVSTSVDQVAETLTTVLAPEAHDRVKKLVALLQLSNKPAEFCVPSCAGYFEAKDGFGLVFEPPADASTPGHQPVPLHDLYRTRKAGLTVRAAIAQKLAQWLLYFHAVNWLHKGLRSGSILFFDEKLSRTSQIYVAGFEFSRAAADQTASTAPPQNPERMYYTHPQYLTNLARRFQKTYDMYSLGIILVELAYWKPINEIVGITVNAENGVGLTGQIRKIRPNLLFDKPELLEHVEAVMGERYYHATKTCLTGMAGDDGLGMRDDQDQADPSIGAMIQQAFIERVVDPLRSIVV